MGLEAASGSYMPRRQASCEPECATNSASWALKCASADWLASERCTSCPECSLPPSRCEDWCYRDAKHAVGPTARSCLLPTSMRGGACSNCPFCAAPNETAYATIVYGTGGARGLFSACSARVLGEALKSIDPSRHRVVVVDDTVPQPMRQLLTDGGLWTIFETDRRLDSMGRKTPLWTLHYRRVFFMDADIFPIQGFGEGPAEAKRRARRLGELWLSRGRVVATRDASPGNHKSRCLNGGLMMIEPDPRRVRRLDRMVSIQREWEAAGHEERHEPYPAGHVFERCPFGHDQPPLNAALRRDWSGFRGQESYLNGLALGPLLGDYCLQGGRSGPGVRDFYQSHTFYHAWAKSTPLAIGKQCNRADRTKDGACYCKLPAADHGYCQAVHNEYAREWWTTFNRSMSAPQQEMCLRDFQGK